MYACVCECVCMSVYVCVCVSTHPQLFLIVVRVGEADTEHLSDAAGGQQPHVFALVTLHEGLDQR